MEHFETDENKKAFEAVVQDAELRILFPKKQIDKGIDPQEKVRIETLAGIIDGIPLPDMTTKEGQKIIEATKVGLAKLSDYIRYQSNMTL